MSSLARRTLHTTAAAAGIAAIGVGIATPAFAAPDLAPAAGATDAIAPAAPAAPANGMIGKIPAVPSNVSELPMLFTFQGPTFNTAGPTLPDPSTVDTEQVMQATGTAPLPAPADQVVKPQDLAGQVHAPEASPKQLTDQNKVGALPDPAMAKQVEGMASKAMAGKALEGNALS
ncbi:hypothetical protein [Pseudonocardia sp. GCM10023141]|uniref:hypothetical protein n=1 Tax=Pseudonocardia sp. GCM10023141 TaxID=3252653 RepID=UPI00361EA414